MDLNSISLSELLTSWGISQDVIDKFLVKLPAQLKILAHLLPPKGRLSKKIKFTTQEAIESLYICVPNAGDIEKVIEEQKEKASSKKLSVQPYIILQGPLHACGSPLLIVDDVRYQFASIMKA